MIIIEEGSSMKRRVRMPTGRASHVQDLNFAPDIYDACQEQPEPLQYWNAPDVAASSGIVLLRSNPHRCGSSASASP
jgi:hypothetical protein